jgi:DNA (cytosine-5)-methyltransferase 1
VKRRSIDKRPLINVVDLFSGGGGWSEGAKQAAKARGIRLKSLGLNHWDLAIKTYKHNHKKHNAMEAELFTADPRRVMLTVIDILIASPECTHHSLAAGGVPKCEQSRSQADIVYRWTQAHKPKYVLNENVTEWKSWGPLYKRGPNKGKPIPHKKGTLFRKYLRTMCALGYTVEMQEAVAADYGDPTTRNRLFVAFTRKDMPKYRFPKASHHKGESWVPARDIIDWDLEGTSIFQRKKPLVDKTLDRIWHGLQKYCKEEYKPFLAMMYGNSTSADLSNPLPTVTAGGENGGVNHYLAEPFLIETAFPGKRGSEDISKPLSTQTCRQTKAIAEPYLVKYRGTSKSASVDAPAPTLTAGGNHIAVAEPFLVNISHSKSKPAGMVRSTELPMPTQVTREEFALATPFLLGQQSGGAPRSVDQPVSTIATAGAISCIKPFLVKFYGTARTASLDNPLPTVTCVDRLGIVTTYGLDIRFRMLQPHELSAAMGFPETYEFSGPKRAQVKQIGNAVAVNTAKAMFGAALDAMCMAEA